MKPHHLAKSFKKLWKCKHPRIKRPPGKKTLECFVYLGEFRNRLKVRTQKKEAPNRYCCRHPGSRTPTSVARKVLESVTKRRNKEKNRARQHLEALQQQQHHQQQLQHLLGTYSQCCVLRFFGPSGSGSISQTYGSGSFYHQAKIVNKTLIPTVLWLLFDLLSLKNYVNVPSE